MHQQHLPLLESELPPIAPEHLAPTVVPEKYVDVTLPQRYGLPMTTPEAAGLSAEQLQGIRSVLQWYVDDGYLPGFVTVVARRGEIAHFETIGNRDVEGSKPIQPDTIFRICSMSKPITSIAAMMLYEEGYFQLDTPISEFIPEFKHMKVYNEDQTEVLDAKTEMTIKHLLMHTAGFTYGWGNQPVDKLYRDARTYEPGLTLADIIKKISSIPLVHEPGEKWTYGISIDVLGYLVEVISGMSFEKFLKTRIFEPLGMIDTAFSVPPEKVDRFASLYWHKKRQAEIKRIEGDVYHQILRRKQASPQAQTFGFDGNTHHAEDELVFFPSGGGGLVSTATDYVRFAQMLLNGGELEGARILDKETIALMKHPHHEDWCGLGFAVNSDKEPLDALDRVDRVGSFSWYGAAATLCWIDPEKELIGLVLTQLLNNDHPFQELFKLLTYQALTD